MTSNRKLPESKFSIVTQQAAGQIPYSYVFVEDDASVRELSPDEKSYLETPFLPLDGGRPAVKDSYGSRNGWGSVRGFCQRSKIPTKVEIIKYEAPDLPSE